MTLAARADESRRLRLRSFETVLVLVVATEYWCRAIPRWDALGTHYTLGLALVPLAGALTFAAPLRAAAFLALAVNHAAVIWNEFPATGNHAYLEAAFCLFAALLDPRRPPEAELYERSLRWMAAVVLFYSGVQKLAHGFYFRGQYLAFSLATESFRPVLRPLLSGSEYGRLLSYSHEAGAGPFVVESWPLLVASNTVWTAELALAPLLLWTRTRTAAALCGLALLLAIEAGARELFFGAIFANALLLSAAVPLRGWLVPAAALLCTSLLAVRAGWLPEIIFY